MLENELKTISTELEQFRKSTNTRKSYPKELKQKVTLLIEQGLPVKRVSDHTGIHATTLNKWRGYNKKTPFVAPQIVKDSTDSDNITLITGLSCDDLLKVLNFLQ
tara:strand:+ start:180 stop:494 length:315 start_codon:yes stop_codon:yes gene_type:complete